MAAGEKTEKPTKKRLDDAKKKGQVPRSRDLAVAAASIAATFAMARVGGHIVNRLTHRMETDLAHFGDNPLAALTGPQIDGLVIGAVQLVAVLVAPIALIAMVAGVGMHGFQGGWVFSPEIVQFNWSRLNPASGMKRFSPMQSLPNTLKNLLSVVVVGYVGWGVSRAVIDDSVRMAWMPPVASAMLAWEHTENLLWKVGWTLVLLAMLDYAHQRYKTMKQLKMSRQELKQEAQESEGNAQVKGRIRRIQRDMARRRMIEDVKNATVVVTNPTHFAVALQYNRDSMLAPKVLAKGRDILAARIREEARKHGIPIVENKPLAQALYKTVEIGETIPAQLFAAVAEVLAYLVRIKQLML
jgi:flagellar biosynthesis protein FlhB